MVIELDWPLIAKDDIKEALGEALAPEVPTLEFFAQFAEPIRIGPVLEVDTETHPDVRTIVEWINANR